MTTMGVGPGGQWVTFQETPQEADGRIFPDSPFAAIRVIAELAYQDFDQRSFRQIFQVPLTGPMWVRAVYHTDNTSTGSITSTAFAGGRSITDDNPLDASGASPTWGVVGPTTLSAASASLSTDGNFGIGKSDWVLVNVPPAIDGGGGGYIYVGTRSTATSRRCQVSAASANYESVVNGLLPGAKYRSFCNASGDNVTTAQNSLVNAAVGGNSFLNNYHACAGIEIRALPGALVFSANAGDSLEAGYGTNINVNPMGYAPIIIAAHNLSAAGRPAVGWNMGSAGKGAAYFNRRVRDALLDTSWRPSHLFLAGWSVNDTITDSTILTGIATALETAQLAKAAGVRQVFLETVTGVNTDGASTVAARLRGNAYLRDQAAAARIPIVDRERLLTDSATNLIRSAYVAADNLHYSMAGNNVVAAEQARLIRTYP